MVEIKLTPLSGESHQAYTMGMGVLTLSLPLHAEFLLMQAITQNIRYTLDGTAPTAGLGFQLKAADPHRDGAFEEGRRDEVFAGSQRRGVAISIRLGKDGKHEAHDQPSV